jgi:hypothetical protein
MERIAIVQLGYESNTFVDTRAGLYDLAPDGWIAAETVVERFTGSRTGIGGILTALAEGGAAAVPMDLLSRNGAFNRRKICGIYFLCSDDYFASDYACLNGTVC